jgi:hypothetical protein
LAGGAAGQVPYQNGPGSTVFTNAVAGVLQSDGVTPAFTDSTTRVKRITAPAADDLEFIAGGASKKIKLQTTSGDITLNTNNGALPDAWTIASTTGAIAGNLSSSKITLNNGAANTLYDVGLVTTAGTNHITAATTAASTLSLRSNGLKC